MRKQLPYAFSSEQIEEAYALSSECIQHGLRGHFEQMAANNAHPLTMGKFEDIKKLDHLSTLRFSTSPPIY